LLLKHPVLSKLTRLLHEVCDSIHVLRLYLVKTIPCPFRRFTHNVTHEGERHLRAASFKQQFIEENGWMDDIKFLLKYSEDNH